MPEQTTTAVCGYCSTGCGLDVHRADGVAVNLSPATDYPVNRGMACPKGWEALTPLTAKGRATTPLARDASGRLTPVPWQRALELFTSRFKGIQAKHGDATVAFLGTGQLPTEELAFFGALTKFGMGLRHGDGNTRQCMASAVVAYKQSFGFDAPPYTYADFEASDVLVFVGSNPCIAHPIMWQRVCRNPHAPILIVLDPRKTETAMAATHHVDLAPKSDLVLLYGIAARLLERGLVDHEFVAAHTSGFEEFAAFLAGYDLGRASEASGVPVAALETVATAIGEGERVSFWWTMGVNQSFEGVRVAQAIIDLALITGNIGRPGTGAGSITGQCNAMGSRLFSNTSSLFGGRDFQNEAHRGEVATILGLPEHVVPTDAGLAYDQIMEGIHRGSIRGLWVVGTNPAHSWINQGDAKELLKRLDFLVVQDMYADTETAALADLVLPAAGWGEKEGTFINSERRLGLLKKVCRAPGQALADFHVFRLIADAWGCGELFQRWRSPEAVFRILQELSADRPCELRGIDGYRALDELRGVQWPAPPGVRLEAGAERRLFEDRRFMHADGRARLIFGEPSPMPELPSPRYPFLLMTGRGSSSQWHTQTRSAKSPVLRTLSPQEAYVELNPQDAERLGISADATVLIRSRRGEMEARAFVTHIVPPGAVFVPMHYSQTNQLTFPAFDPESRQPSYKACAVAIRAVG